MPTTTDSDARPGAEPDDVRLLAMPRSRGPVTGALIALLSGPPARDPGVAGDVLADLWHARDARRPWWEIDADVALALIHLAELRRHGLRGVESGWRSHRLTQAAEQTLAEPVVVGLAQLARDVPADAPARGCAVVRAILAASSRRRETYLPSLGIGHPERFRTAVALTVAQRVVERTLAAELLQVQTQPVETAAEVLELLGVPWHAARLDELPASVLWQLAIPGQLGRTTDLHAAALGWLVSSHAAVAAGRTVTGATLRAHDVDRVRAAAWDGDLGEPSTWMLVDVVEQAVDTDPRLAAPVLAGATAAIRAAESAETALEALWTHPSQPDRTATTP